MAALLGTRRVWRRAVLTPVAVLAGVVAAWSVVALARPGDAGPTPCPWRAVTGLDCPFCGGTRAAAALATGDPMAALDHNALFVVVIVPLAVAAWLAWFAAAWRGRPPPVVSNRAWLVGIGLTMAWWALRLAVPWLASDAA